MYNEYRNQFVTQYMCYKPIPIIYRTSLLQNSLKVIIIMYNDIVLYTFHLFFYINIKTSFKEHSLYFWL
jgi:hypothetical protein